MYPELNVTWLVWQNMHQIKITPILLSLTFANFFRLKLYFIFDPIKTCNPRPFKRTLFPSTRQSLWTGPGWMFLAMSPQRSSLSACVPAVSGTWRPPGLPPTWRSVWGWGGTAHGSPTDDRLPWRRKMSPGQDLCIKKF